MVCKTAQVQDYLPLVGDPGEVGKTAQERKTPGASLLGLFVLNPPPSELGSDQNKNPLPDGKGFSSLVARPRIELGTS